MDWIDKYVELLYTKDGSKLDTDIINEAKELKYENMPEKFYKYRKIDAYSLENFENDRIWLTTANNYNDPYDCALKLDYDNKYLSIKKEKAIKLFETKLDVVLISEKKKELKECNDLNKFYTILVEKYKEQKHQDFDTKIIVQKLRGDVFEDSNIELTRVAQEYILNCSFSEKNDSILMWSHYANNHTGFCLEYDFKKLGKDNEFTGSLQPIIYTDKIFDITPYAEDIGNLNKLIASFITMHKSKEWSYEKEWRYSIAQESNAISFSKNVQTPTKVILGAKITEENEMKMRDIAKSKGILVEKMKMKSDEFKLIPITVE